MLRDGAGKNWTAHIISVVPGSNPIFCAGADLDGDRDVDLVVADFGGNTIRWYENHAHVHDEPNTWNDTSINRRWSTHVIATDAMGVRTVSAADVDGDGDLDVLAAARLDKEGLTWYENVGVQSGLWKPHKIGKNQEEGSYFALPVDMDNDGDIDALSASVWTSTVSWYENIDGIGESWSTHEIATSAAGACSVFGIDVNGDNWTDVLSTDLVSGTVAW